MSQPSMDGVLDAIADEGCRSLLEEVFLDLEVGLCCGGGAVWAAGAGFGPSAARPSQCQWTAN